MQCGLFGTGTPRISPATFDVLRGVARIELTDGAWLEHHPGWLEGHERVFHELTREAAWISERRRMYEHEVDVPRLVARAPTGGSLFELLKEISGTLSERYRCALGSSAGEVALARCRLAQYRDGADSVAFHGDRIGRDAAESVVATVSVGTPRRFVMKPNAGGRALSWRLGWGDLFVMGGTCQRTWQHAVPKCVRADPRISIIFRAVTGR
ncbi:MAG TPA: alpha-ketoglutarate-dependent dioxygenase AlkB [Polyangiaceae bacterium]|nr:alpha-ketoglutarate-dependent dioxygenase AlkB [Polyangiaceae bacterium]